MKSIAIIPLRAGSKTILNKNTKSIAGRPLMNWALQAAVGSKYIDEVIIATDSDEIAELALLQNHPKIKIYKRSVTSATDQATSESVLIEYLEKNSYAADDLVYLIQATNPFLSSIKPDLFFADIRRTGV